MASFFLIRDLASSCDTPTGYIRRHLSFKIDENKPENHQSKKDRTADADTV
jgi:hypothetical protein